MHGKFLEEAEHLLAQSKISGLRITLSGRSAVRLQGTATNEQIQRIKKYKAELIEILSPRCTTCGLSLQLINENTLWFCPFGCESQPVE